MKNPLTFAITVAACILLYLVITAFSCSDSEYNANRALANGDKILALEIRECNETFHPKIALGVFCMACIVLCGIALVQESEE